MMHAPIVAAAPRPPVAAFPWCTLNAKIDGHIAAGAEADARLLRTLDDMAARHVEDAAFNERWNAPTYCEAVAFMRERHAGASMHSTNGFEGV